MKRKVISLLRRLLREDAGQSIVVLAASMVGFFGLAGISIESGHAYVAYRQLVASTNAATLAGAQAMPNITQATTNVTTYSSITGDKNASSLLTNVKIAPTFACLTTVTNTLVIPCQTASDGKSYNSIEVTQTANMPTWIAGIFGMTTFNFSYTSYASMSGGTASNWNIAIILDGTASMKNNDSGKQCSGTQEHCALLGMQALLEDLYPCALGTTCSGGTTSYVDDVSLYVFPPTTTPAYDYCSGGDNPQNITNGDYVVPTLGTGETYQIINLSNDYKTNDSNSTLNTSSNLVAASGYTGTSCAGVYPKGGAGTYYAQAIYQAQSDLATQQGKHPGSRNAMIILSDGDATATVTYTTTQTCTGSGRTQHCTTTNTGTASNSDLQESTADSLNGLTYNNPTSYTYPSAVGECGQAVVAAQTAATDGTSVYTIGYGAETSGCTTDATYSASVTTGGGSWGAGDSPCQALAAMASVPANFYSDDGNGCQATSTSNQNFTTLTAIFRQIVSGLTTPRIIPNTTK